MKQLQLIAALLLTAPIVAQVHDATDLESTKRFGNAIARAFNERDAKAMESLIDLRGLAPRAAKVQGLSPADQEKFVRGAESAGTSGVVASYMGRLNSSQGTASFMRATHAHEARALVRLDFGQQGVDYLEYVLETTQQRVRAVDWFQLSTGELASVTLGGVAQMFTTDDAGLLSRLFGVDQVDQTAMENMRKIGELQRQAKYAEALALLKKLPDPIANSRIMLATQASMAMGAKQVDEYTRILAKLAEKYADDPSAALLLLDHYFTTRDLPRLFKAIDTIEKRIGVDGFTRHLRAIAYCSTGDYAKCLKYAEESTRIEPELVDGHHDRATALVGLGRYADAIAQYRHLERKFELRFTRGDFAGEPQYAKFAASPEFRAWLSK